MLSACLYLALHSYTQVTAKKPLDQSVYDGWKTIRAPMISDDGKWVAYTVAPQVGDGKLYVYSTDRSSASKPAYTVDRGNAVGFSGDSRFLIVSQSVPYAETRNRPAVQPGTPPTPAPAASLEIIDLKTGAKFDRARVAATRIALHDKGWLAYSIAPDRPASGAGAAGRQGPPPAGGMRGTGGRRGGGGGGQGTGAATPTRGQTWIIRNLTTGKEQTLEDVSDVIFDREGTEAVYITTAQDKKKDGITLLALPTGKALPVVTGPGRYLRTTFSDDGKHLAYLSDSEAPDAKPPILRVYLYDVGAKGPRTIVKEDSPGLPTNWSPMDGGLSFSRDNRRLFFGANEKPVEDKPDPTPADEKAQVDIWNWKDSRLMSQQLHDVAQDRNVSYRAVADLRSGKIAMLTNYERPRIEIGDKESAPFALALTNRPYELQDSWDGGISDMYCVNVSNGEAIPILTGVRADTRLNPTGSIATVFDLQTNRMTSYDLRSGAASTVRLPPTSLVNTEDDHPSLPPMYGFGPYASDGKSMVVYDQFDAWLVDITGKREPQCLTRGYGRRWSDQMRLLPMNEDPDDGTIDLHKPLIFAVRNLEDESSGLYKLDGEALTKLVFGPKLYSGFVKAKGADTMLYTESTFQEYPDLWLTDTSMSAPIKISDANPQQADYLWGTCELVHWIGNDGQKLKGLLYLPENFDRTKKYPMITYYYERDSAGLHAYRAPAPSASTINIPLFVSQGYVIFDPDIDYKVGYPGPSAYSAIIPGIQSIVARGFVDPKRLGIQGQSWGGYETAYLVTQTSMFAAAEAGAPVGDMFSAYGGIRNESGVVREGQYEHGQSRIGGDIWDKPMQYYLNSPVFWADRIETPLMIMSNDADGAVPHEQGIELFTAMRRLGKPSWMVVYNAEQHNLVERRNRKDLSIRLSQFFDHFLKGAPMPEWMSKGVPAVNKGKDYGFKLDPAP